MAGLAIGVATSSMLDKDFYNTHQQRKTSMLTTTCARELAVFGRGSANPIDETGKVCCGARGSVAADRLVSARPKKRPATESPTVEPTQRWCSDCGKGRVNVTGNSTRTVGLHPSRALGLCNHRSGTQVEKETFPSHPAEPCSEN